jgi:hypothetical protein
VPTHSAAHTSSHPLRRPRGSHACSSATCLPAALALLPLLGTEGCLQTIASGRVRERRAAALTRPARRQRMIRIRGELNGSHPQGVALLIACGTRPLYTMIWGLSPPPAAGFV